MSWEGRDKHHIYAGLADSEVVLAVSFTVGLNGVCLCDTVHCTWIQRVPG